MRVAVGFYRINWWVMRCMSFCSRAKYDHCSFMFLEDGADDIPYVLHVSKRSYAKFVRLAALNKVYKPEKVVYVGETNATPEDIVRILSPPKKFCVWKTVVWFFFTRWFSKWKPPGGCGVMTCTMLHECGFEVGTYVVPTRLYKEISNATNFPIRTSRSR